MDLLKFPFSGCLARFIDLTWRRFRFHICSVKRFTPCHYGLANLPLTLIHQFMHAKTRLSDLRIGGIDSIQALCRDPFARFFP